MTHTERLHRKVTEISSNYSHCVSSASQNIKIVRVVAVNKVDNHQKII